MMRGWMAEARRGVSDPAFTPAPATWNSNGITAAWLGHSTVLINFYGVTILTDPALFGRVGADTICGVVGPKRLVAPALTVKQLPQIDLVLLSHAHMDHLDFPTLRCIPAGTQVVTARATADLLRGTKLKEPKELGWGEQARVSTPRGDLEIEAFTVKHWGARWKYDKYRGYNGYIISREGKKLLFGGDTALSESFRPLRSRGPFELAIMPIGAYNPWEFAHCTPEQAVRMADEAGANHFAPVHCQTFAFGREPTAEPIERLEAAIENERIAWREVGATFALN
jgi:L-ascorbate metabolism protein UlaG (beta-lactamase superfamily)